MTEDYKEILLRYFTGNLNNQSGTNIPDFTQQEETLNANVYENINTKLTTDEGAVSFTATGKIYNETYGSYLIYGFYENSDSNYYGFIYLVDDELNEIQMITELVSGTKLFPLVSLNQAADGNIYGLSHTIGTTPGTTRVLLFNNIFSSGLIDGVYKAILRNDYILPYSYYPTWYRQNCITKSPDGSVYYMVLQDGNGNTHIVKFTINVGSTNDWQDYSITGIFQYRYAVKLDKSGGDEIFRFYCMSYFYDDYEEYKLENGTITKIKSIALEGSPSISPGFSQVYELGGEIFVTVSYSTTLHKAVLYKVNDDQLQTITTTNYYQDQGYISGYNLFAINDGLFYIKTYNKNTEKDLYVGYVDRGTATEEYIATSETAAIYNSNYSYVDFYVTVLYNLVNMYLPVYGQTNTTERLTFDYNSLNYNGTDYESKYALIPIKGRIYDENDKMIFARNLYNKTIYGNTTLSQVQVPNTLLNSSTLYTSNLIGQTNKVLIESEDNVTKNIYETLYFNYYNTLMVQDRNTEVYVDNMIGANRINSSVSNLADYDNAKAIKYRVNYSDNTSLTNNVDSVVIDNDTQIATYTMQLYVPTTKIATNVEIISQDETTIYQTIDTSSLTQGKAYNITQDCYVE